MLSGVDPFLSNTVPSLYVTDIPATYEVMCSPTSTIYGNFSSSKFFKLSLKSINYDLDPSLAANVCF